MENGAFAFHFPAYFPKYSELKKFAEFFQCYIEIENCHALKIAYEVKGNSRHIGVFCDNGHSFFWL